ncbi:hypothetical protein ACHAWU_002134 [Discostella pseudostelligera]|uniref:PDEase domain-containing protein n=1 Tax=Discostella pseudostelligera TaxID=259834 RepID=A0ABD3MGN5_9STRA
MSRGRREESIPSSSSSGRPSMANNGDLISSHVIRDSADLPPITTDTPPTVLQQQLSGQAWDRVSARQPVGSHDHEPDVGTLIDYLSTIMETRLADVVKHRKQLKLPDEAWTLPRVSDGSIASASDLSSRGEVGRHTAAASSSSQATILLTSTCRSELRAYVGRIASMYRSNRYHGLEHATHVTMSANKLLDMLHEDPGESDDDVDDDEVTEINDFSASEPIIRQDFTQSDIGCKFQTNEQNFSASDSRLSFPPTRMNGYSTEDSNPYHLYSDMLTKFAFVFAAMIHDVDHQGVPNTRLVVEKDPLVEQHGRTSVAEKHSIQIAFQTLCESTYDEFRSTIFSSPDDYLHMHRIVTNVVVSTDIASPERMHSTTMRWQAAFSRPVPKTVRSSVGRLSLAGKSPLSEIATVHASKPQLVPVEIVSTMHNGYERTKTLKRVLEVNGGQSIEYFSDVADDDDARMALQQSVVIETMLNVADVAHSMQSWELFLFWNRRLFEELFVAFKVGRSDHEPSGDWYENQLGFYAIYVIPLAEKMKQCKVFGALGGEWVNNATFIRDRWKLEGEQITKDMIACVKRDYL